LKEAILCTYFSALSPTNITLSDFSSINFAAEIGFLILLLTDATAPACMFLPSMMEASISIKPFLFFLDPFPALNSPLSSISLMAKWTTSKLVAPS